MTTTATRCEISIGASYDTGELAVDDTSTAPWWWPIEPGVALGTAPCTEYSACSANCVAVTATTVRVSVSRPPATVRQRSVEKAIESTTGSSPGGVPPPTVCESAATNVAKDAIATPCATRAHLEVTREA